MFGKLFGKGIEGGGEISLDAVASREFDNGVNGPAIFSAFERLKRINRERNLGHTNNHLLNTVREAALGSVSPMDRELLGGQERIEKDINSEIERLREGLTDEERGS